MDQSTSVQPGHDVTAAGEGNPPPQPTSVAPTESKEEKATPTPQKQKIPDGEEEDDDEESDLDDLDEVLDDFSKPSTTTTDTTTKQKEPANDEPATQSQPLPTALPAGDEAGDFDEQAFMKQLEQDMANMMSQAQNESGTGDNKDFQDTVEQGADAFAKQLEESGVPPGDFLKQLLGEVMAEEGGPGADALAGAGAGAGVGTDKKENASAKANEAAAAEGTPESFNDAIQRTMNRMQESGNKATAAASDNDGDVPDEILLQLLKALESTGAGNEDDIQKMFMGFMEKVSSKDILYEPLKELDEKFEPWIAEKQGKGELSQEDVSRYQMQTKIVKDVVGKFEETGYSDDDPKCREWVWERMQEMQNAGNPPDELIPNPLSDMKSTQDAALPSECAQQ